MSVITVQIGQAGNQVRLSVVPSSTVYRTAAGPLETIGMEILKLCAFTFAGSDRMRVFYSLVP